MNGSELVGLDFWIGSYLYFVTQVVGAFFVLLLLAAAVLRKYAN